MCLEYQDALSHPLKKKMRAKRISIQITFQFLLLFLYRSTQGRRRRRRRRTHLSSGLGRALVKSRTGERGPRYTIENSTCSLSLLCLSGYFIDVSITPLDRREESSIEALLIEIASVAKNWKVRDVQLNSFSVEDRSGEGGRKEKVRRNAFRVPDVPCHRKYAKELILNESYSTLP